MAAKAAAFAGRCAQTVDDEVSHRLTEFKYPQIKMVLDPQRGKKYYQNTTTGKSGWTLQAAMGDQKLADDIEERWDVANSVHFYFNKCTGKTGWSRKDVETEAPAPVPVPAPAPALVPAPADPSAYSLYALACAPFTHGTYFTRQCLPGSTRPFLVSTPDTGMYCSSVRRVPIVYRPSCLYASGLWSD